MISDGECAEGSIWESLRIAQDHKIYNLKIIINVNGWGAYDAIHSDTLYKRLQGFGLDIQKINGHDIKDLIRALKSRKKNKLSIVFANTKVDQLPFLEGQEAHYHVMTNENFAEALELLK